jgi:hypothetical protein
MDQQKAGGTVPSETKAWADVRDPLVQLKLSEIQRIRDALMRLRDYSPMIRNLWSQVAGLYQRLGKDAQRRPVTATTKPEREAV